MHLITFNLITLEENQVEENQVRKRKGILFGWLVGFYLKQQKFILLQFRTLEVQNQNHWTKIKLSAGPCSPWRLQEKICSLPLSASGGCQHSLSCNHILQTLPLWSHCQKRRGLTMKTGNLISFLLDECMFTKGKEELKAEGL